MSCIGGVVYNCGNISGWPPLPYPLFSSPPQQPPLQPPPNPPPPRARVKTEHYLMFARFAGANVKVVDWRSAVHLPSFHPIALQWQHYPTGWASPRIITSTTNSAIDFEGLKIYKGDVKYVRIFNAWDPFYALPIIVVQFLFHNQRWIVAVHEVQFPLLPLPTDWWSRKWEYASPDVYRFILNNRQEKLVVFYDSAIQGFGSFEYENEYEGVAIHLSPTTAIISYADAPDFPIYFIQPTSSPAYCMYIEDYRGLWYYE
jgi:hypothetical protein